ncbi:MAG: transporter substrate-binding domain-containing protein [Bacteroidales bacterium]|nr:transporter substrate-binding domain-containing protein [Bacteroidales bacterium]
MKKSSLLMGIVLMALALLLCGCEKSTTDAYPYTFKFISEEYKPLNYVENSVVKGLAPDLLKEICKKMNIPFEVEILPWSEGYAKTQSTSNAVLFSTVLNSARKDLFKWAGPIASLDWFFYSSPSFMYTINSLDDAKKSGIKIGVVKDYSIEQYLKQEGFTNFIYCTNNVNAFDKLLKGEIDLYPCDKLTAEAALKTLNKTIYSVSNKHTIRTDLLYFAFNKQVPDEVVGDFQQTIDALKIDGTLRTITQEYLNSLDSPGILQLYTEQYPPLTYRNSNGEITGFGTDVVLEIMKRTGQLEPIKLSNWSNGYELALNNPNVCLFTMDRTTLRQNLFQWVGPIGTNTTWFYTKAGSGVTITSIDNAKTLSSVGTVTSWFSDQHLRSLGFNNLVSNSDPKVMAKKLMDGEIAAFVCSGVTFGDILKEIGYHYSSVVPAFSLMSSDYYIAFSKNTPVSVLTKWQNALESAKQDGTYQAIYKKWFQ